MARFSRRQIMLSGSAGITGLATVVAAEYTHAKTQVKKPMNETVLQKLLERAEIIDTVNKVALMSDLRDWTGCRACFTDQVEVDYTSLVGGKPATISADALIEQWRNNLSGFKATQHLIANHAVTLNGDTATCVSQFHAQHFLPNDKGEQFWTLGGVYNHELVRSANGWRVRKMKMTATWEQGNRQLLSMAANRPLQKTM